MGSIAIDMTGMRFERLLVIRKMPTVNKRAMWECECDCGVIKTIIGKSLRLGQTKSCGCYSRDNIIKRSTKHGMSKKNGEVDKTYRAWKSLRQRCYNPNDSSYKNYGQRGIKACKRWDDYKSFVSDMGEIPYEGATVERVDVNGDYCPENCVWIPHEDQAKNRRPFSEWDCKNR